MNYESEEQLTIYSVIEYISENFIGLILLVFAFLIIYFVDYINRLNSMLLSPESPIPVLPTKLKSKKLKKL